MALKHKLIGLVNSVPYISFLAPTAPLHLLYHGIPAFSGDGLRGEHFENHMKHLREKFEFLHPNSERRPRTRSQKPQVVLTFDDGFLNNYEVAFPVLRNLGIPAVFFVSNRHASPGKYLWFSYLSALRQYLKSDSITLMGQTWDMSEERRPHSIKKLSQKLLALDPHLTEMYKVLETTFPDPLELAREDIVQDQFEGMRKEHVKEIHSHELFEIGIHSVDHPYLTRCTDDEILVQLADNKTWLEDATGQVINTIAYPIGDYDSRVLKICGTLGVKTGYAVIPQLNTQPDMEIVRIGVYDTSLEILELKVLFGTWMRQLNLKVG